MPELPEVQTTVNGLQKVLPRLAILDVWTDLATNNPTRPDYKDTIKYLPFFRAFKNKVTGAKFKNVERRAKNILINLDNGYTILVHMKMTGHLLYGEYTVEQVKNEKLKVQSWKPVSPEALKDPYNRFVHVVFTLSNGKYLALCDSRKFAKMTILKTNEAHTTKHLSGLGPEPLHKDFTQESFLNQIKKSSTSEIKTVLLDQKIIAGIGNIYSDEALWIAGINPKEKVENITKIKVGLLYKAIKKVLIEGINFGGDSMSDYRNVDGAPGRFHHRHNVYRKKGERCGKPGCRGVILRKVVGGRSAHFCSIHQKLLHA